MIPVFDSNIVIDFMNGREEAAQEIQRYPERLLSIISWMEVLVGAKTQAAADSARETLGYFTVLELTNNIAERAVRIRQEHRIALPDAIIWATARSRETLLVTRNVKDFPTDQPDIRIPYQF